MKFKLSRRELVKIVGAIGVNIFLIHSNIKISRSANLLQPSSDGAKHFCSWSPEGDKIIYNSNYQLWVLDVNKKSRFQLTNSDVNVGGEFSPNGEMIAFVSIEGDTSEICIMDYVESQITKTDNKCFLGKRKILNPQWSPDGKKIAFVRIDESGRHIWLMKSDGSNQAPLTTDLGNIECWSLKWSPHGKKIAFSTSRNNTSEKRSVWIMNADGSDKKELTEGGFPEWISKNIITYVNNKGDLWRMNVDGGDTKLLATNVSWGYSISSSGDIIYFDLKDNLWIMNEEKVKLSTNRFSMFPACSPNGEYIAFMSGRSGCLDIWIVSWQRDSKKVEFIVPPEKYQEV